MSNLTINGEPAPLFCDPEVNLCLPRGREDTPCNEDGSCAGDGSLLFCNEGRCESTRNTGEACQQDRYCLGGYCNPGGTCGLPREGGVCEVDRERPCAGTALCVADCEGSQPCLGVCSRRGHIARGQACELDALCATGFCRNGTCDLAAFGEECGRCEQGLRCSDGTCLRAAGSTCLADTECADGRCDTARDRTQRCIAASGTRCNDRRLDGDFYDICVGDCSTLCRSCYWNFGTSTQTAYCIDDCDEFEGNGECYN